MSILPLHHHWALDVITTQTHTATTPKHRDREWWPLPPGHLPWFYFSTYIPEVTFPGTYLAMESARAHMPLSSLSKIWESKDPIFSVSVIEGGLYLPKTCNTGRVMRFCKAPDDQGLPPGGCYWGHWKEWWNEKWVLTELYFLYYYLNGEWGWDG